MLCQLSPQTKLCALVTTPIPPQATACGAFDQRAFDDRGPGRDSPLPHERDVDAVGGGDSDEGNEAAHDGRQTLGEKRAHAQHDVSHRLRWSLFSLVRLFMVWGGPEALPWP